MPGSDERERAYRFAFDEAVRAIAHQQAVIDGYRTRAGVMLSAAAVATSFFGGQAISQTGLGVWSWAAIVLFGGVGVALVGVMTPGRLRNLFGPGQHREGLKGFVARPSILIGGYIEADRPQTLAETYRNVALHIENHVEENEAILVRRVDQRFRVAALLLFVEIAVWMVELA